MKPIDLGLARQIGGQELPISAMHVLPVSVVTVHRGGISDIAGQFTLRIVNALDGTAYLVPYERGSLNQLAQQINHLLSEGV